MKIEIAEPGRMTQNGSSLLKLIQNNDMPILDLLVRESVQNSLDAAKADSKYVSIDFIIDKFNSKELNNCLEEITIPLNKRFKDLKYEYIAIRDKNTTGLTGVLDYKDVKNNEYGNLLKLIYEISKPQDSEGAGGSWGLGKTIYFRIGIGLVFYYTRIFEDGKYKSRLAATLVEDENNKNSLIPKYKDFTKRGIAWWGEATGENKTNPITDEEKINKILDIFNLKPYEKKETGTSIIIPYIDKQRLCKNNSLSMREKDVPFWIYDIKDYINIALQRWYSPRLNNFKYKYGPYLCARINGDNVEEYDLEPIFEIIQDLYNIASDKPTYNKVNRDAVYLEDINLRNCLEKQTAGKIAFTKVSSKLLEMNPPNNKYNPYIYANIDIDDINTEKPIILFTRKPGMIVFYETVGNWTSGIISNNKNEYIIGIFVLNSNNHLINDKMSLEEYIRRCELADHTSWTDVIINNKNLKIVSKIQSNLTNKISKKINERDNNIEGNINSTLGSLLGSLLLPPEDFGKAATHKSKKRINKKKNNITKNHKYIFKVFDEQCKYLNNYIEIPFTLKTLQYIRNIEIKVQIQLDGNKSISLIEWEKQLNKTIPFNIENVKYLIDRRTNDEAELDSTYLKNENGIKYGIVFNCDKNCLYEMRGIMKLNIIDRNINSLISINEIEGDE